MLCLHWVSCDGRANPFKNVSHPLRIGAWNDNQELLPAEAAKDIVGSKGALCTRYHLAEHLASNHAEGMIVRVAKLGGLIDEYHRVAA